MAEPAAAATPPTVGLALSGGGFRAVLLHVGALWRMVELGVLAKVDRVSSVSGGSIVAGVLASRWDEWKADPSLANYCRLVADPLDRFCTKLVDAVAISRGALSPFRTAADVLEEIYTEELFSGRLDQLPDSPAFVFCATNMQTGRLFRFSKKRLADYRLGEILHPTLPIARAVTASSAFPPMLSPLVIKNPGTFQPLEGADLNQDPHYTAKLYLADGGVYDNLGLEQVWKRCSHVLVSDAGAPFAVGPNPGNDWVRQPMRALDIATDQSRGLRKRWLMAMAGGSLAAAAKADADGLDEIRACVDAKTRKTVAYWGIDTRIGDYGLGDALPVNPAIVGPLARIRTRLDPFNDEERCRLINWGYALADASLRTCGGNLVSSKPAPRWPRRDFPLDAQLARHGA